MTHRILVALAACAFVQLAGAKDYVIPEDTTFSFPAGVVSAGGNPTNSWNHVLVLNSGCTMKFTSPSTGSVAVYVPIVVQGDATLDFGEWTHTTCPALYALMVKNGAKLTFRGPDGRDGFVIRLGRGNGADLSDFSASNPVYDLDGIVFDGVAGLQFDNSFVLRTLPSDPDVLAKLSVVAGATVGLAGTNTVAAWTDDNGNFDCDCDVYVMSETAVPAGKGVNLRAGRKLTVSPASFTTYGSYCDRTLNPEPGFNWSPVRVTSMGAGATVSALRRSPVTVDGSMACWGCSSAGVTEIYQAAAGSTVSLAGCVAKPGAKVFANEGTDYVFTDAGGVPIVTTDDLTVDLATAADPTVYANGGVTTLDDVVTPWDGDVPLLWLDASRAETFMHTGCRSELAIDSGRSIYAQPVFIENADNAMLVEQWCDWRDADHPYGRDVAIMNNRIYTTTTWSAFMFPYLRPSGGPTGGRYLSFGRLNDSNSTALSGNMVNTNGEKVASRASKDACRLLFYEKADKLGMAPSQKQRTDIKTVVMVFGSQLEGGYAPLATANYIFHRGGATLDDPVTTNETHALWLNGAAVVPNETKFSGGWDVLSIETKNLNLIGLGYPGGNGQSEQGGQNYAEILFFTNELTSVQRENVERYLAHKWGLASKYARPRTARLMGAAGTVAVKGGYDAVKLSGTFAGTLALEGAEVEVANDFRPPTTAEIPSDGRIGWFDPDNTEGVTISGEIVTTLWNEGVKKSANRHLMSSGGRAPHPLSSARGFGTMRRWVDYNDPYLPVQPSNNGNVLRVRTHDGESMGEADTPFENVRTVVMVQDSVRGGGAPFLTAVQGVPRRSTDDFTADKWLNDSTKEVPDAYLSAATRLNGVSSPAAEGFSGAPEVYSVVASEDMAVGAFANIYNSQGLKYNGEILGEILLYSRALEGAELANVEAYLMNKWLNVLPAGYGDLSGATLTGSGKVSAAKWSQLPKIGASFAGTVSAASVGDGLAFSIGTDGTVAGAILAPDATLSLPSACAATVTLPDARLAAGEYVLVDCKGWGETEWTLTVVDPRSDRRQTSTSVGAGRIVLKVAPIGMMLLVR